MRTWTVRLKGRLERIAIFYFFLSLIIISILLYASRRGKFNLLAMNSSDTFEFLLITSPIWIPLFVVTFKKLLSSKIPKEVSFDDQTRNIKITYSKRKQEVISFDNLAYSHSDQSRNHISLTFYKTFLGTRGQQVYKEVVQIIGMKWTLSWNVNQLKELIEYLENAGIEKKVNHDENMSLFDKIIST